MLLMPGAPGRPCLDWALEEERRVYISIEWTRKIVISTRKVGINVIPRLQVGREEGKKAVGFPGARRHVSA